MKKDEAIEVVSNALQQLNDELAQGQSARLTTVLEMMARFNNYSTNNLMLIFEQFPEASRVAGFGTWKKLGRWVKAGEKGIGIFAPIKRSTKDQEQDPLEPIGYRVVYVFDVSQTDGEPLPKVMSASGDAWFPLAKLEHVYAELGIKIELCELSEGHYGTSRGGVVEVSTGLTSAERFAVLAHELAHELLHSSKHMSDRPSKAMRETEAEAVSFVVCTALGLDRGSSSSDYIQLHRGDAKLLMHSLERISSDGFHHPDDDGRKVRSS